MNATAKSLLRVGNKIFSLSPEFLSWGSVSEKTVSDTFDAANDLDAASVLMVNLLK